MAEIFLVRHGQASFGSDNYDKLSPLGEQQALWLGEYFATRGVEFDRVLTGTQFRHEQTAKGILAGMGKADGKGITERTADLNEYDFMALYRALPADSEVRPDDPAEQRRYFYRRLKQALTLWADAALPGPLPESWVEFQRRVANVAETLCSHAAKRTLVVSSGGPMGAFIQHVLDAPAHTAIELNLQICNTSVSQFFINKRALRLMSFNSLPHLDRPDRQHAITYA